MLLLQHPSGRKLRISNRPSVPSHFAPVSQPNKVDITTILHTFHHTHPLNIDNRHRLRADSIKVSIEAKFFAGFQLTAVQLLHYQYHSTISQDATACHQTQQILYKLQPEDRPQYRHEHIPLLYWSTRDAVGDGDSLTESVFLAAADFMLGNLRDVYPCPHCGGDWGLNCIALLFDAHEIYAYLISVLKKKEVDAHTSSRQ